MQTTEMWLFKGFQDTDCIEIIVEKGEIAHLSNFTFFPQCFAKAFFFNVLKRVYMEEKVNEVPDVFKYLYE